MNKWMIWGVKPTIFGKKPFAKWWHKTGWPGAEWLWQGDSLHRAQDPGLQGAAENCGRSQDDAPSAPIWCITSIQHIFCFFSTYVFSHVVMISSLYVSTTMSLFNIKNIAYLLSPYSSFYESPYRSDPSSKSQKVHISVGTTWFSSGCVSRTGPHLQRSFTALADGACFGCWGPAD